MRDFRVLSARGHPETLKREERGKNRDTLPHAGPTQGQPHLVNKAMFNPWTAVWEKEAGLNPGLLL